MQQQCRNCFLRLLGWWESSWLVLWSKCSASHLFEHILGIKKTPYFLTWLLKKRSICCAYICSHVWNIVLLDPTVPGPNIRYISDSDIPTTPSANFKQFGDGFYRWDWLKVKVNATSKSVECTVRKHKPMFPLWDAVQCCGTSSFVGRRHEKVRYVVLLTEWLQQWNKVEPTGELNGRWWLCFVSSVRMETKQVCTTKRGFELFVV